MPGEAAPRGGRGCRPALRGEAGSGRSEHGRGPAGARGVGWRALAGGRGGGAGGGAVLAAGDLFCSARGAVCRGAGLRSG